MFKPGDERSQIETYADIDDRDFSRTLESLREPLAGLAIASDAGDKWLDRPQPNTEEVRQLLILISRAARDALARLPQPPS